MKRKKRRLEFNLLRFRTRENVERSNDCSSDKQFHELAIFVCSNMDKKIRQCILYETII